MGGRKEGRQEGDRLSLSLSLFYRTLGLGGVSMAGLSKIGNKQISKQASKQERRSMYGCTDREMDGEMDGRMDGYLQYPDGLIFLD